LPRSRRSYGGRATQYEQAIPGAWAAALPRAKPRIRLGRNAIGNVLFLGLVGWGLIWLFVSERFYVSQVTVIGNRRVSADVIREASRLSGYSIFWIDPRQVAADIARTLPPIKDVKIRYNLSNAVTITVQEQGEQVMWQVAGQRYWVDDEGALHAAQGEDEPSLIVRDIRPVPPGHVDRDALIAARQATRLFPELRVIEYAPITGLRFEHPRGWVVYLGTGSDMARKASVLRAMEVQFVGEGAAQPTLIDLRFPDSPYYRLATDDAGGE
jgi:cell division septal protein FtsQ